VSYRETLSAPGVARLYAASLVSRLPYGFGSLAVLLLVRDVTDSFTMAGAAVTASLAVMAVSAAPLGRLIDRDGQTAILRTVAAVNTTAFAALAVAGAANAPGPALVLLAAATGVVPPVSSCLRAILADTFDGAKLQAAYATEAVMQEGVYIVGPLLATVAVALSGPPAAVAAAAALTLAGTLWFAALPLSRTWRAPQVARRRGGALRAAPIRLLCGFAALAGAAFGAFEVAVTAFARESGHPNLAGLLLAGWALGSMAGGAWAGGRAWRRPVEVRFAWCAAAISAGFVPALLAPSLAAFVPASLIAGVAIAPALTLVYTLCGRLAPEGMVTEAFTWLNVAFPIGIGVGAGLAGPLADGPGARAAFGLSVAATALAAAMVAWRRGTLAPRQPGRSQEHAPSARPDVR
jgi:MFS family permease